LPHPGARAAARSRGGPRDQRGTRDDDSIKGMADGSLRKRKGTPRSAGGTASLPTGGLARDSILQVQQPFRGTATPAGGSSHPRAAEERASLSGLLQWLEPRLAPLSDPSSARRARDSGPPEEVDGVDPEPLERRLGDLLDVRRTAVEALEARTPVGLELEAELGGDHPEMSNLKLDSTSHRLDDVM
jgi:hypothetical protein